ncbi:MAG TPA: hypothetical protein VMT45_02885 [Thermoanaerobaculaceae bacterium]|nr:hypothetical protein [Thermoanaerobaculaceae bacterium]
MIPARVQALLPGVAFAVLGVVLAAIGAIPPREAIWAAASVLAAFLPTGWVAASGWRRRAAEALLLPAAYALVMVDDPTMRRMALPPLLILAAMGAMAGHGRASERSRPVLLAALAVAARAACGIGLLGLPIWHVGLVFAAVAAVGWGVTRAAGPHAGAIGALLAGTLPLQRAPLWVAAAILLVSVAVSVVPRMGAGVVRIARGWLPGAAAVALAAAAVSPWGGIRLHQAFPTAGWLAATAFILALAAAPWLPPAMAGAVWLVATLPLGPPQPPPPDRPAVELSASHPMVSLPPSSGGIYMLDLTLVNAATVPAGTPVATVMDAGAPVVLHAGADAAEWSHERPDVRRQVAHPLPKQPVWRPAGIGRDAVWGVAGRTEGLLPAGVTPRLIRDADLPPQVTLVAAAAGTEQPTPPRDWSLAIWLLAAAVVVAILQFASRTWRSGWAAVPWAILAAASLFARARVEPLRLLAERHAVDFALAALVAAWLPTAVVWLRQRRVFVTAAALLVPLAIATPHLTPPLYGDEPYHLILLQSLTGDHDLDLSNNYDLEHHPYNRIYLGGFMQPPFLAMLLLPGYLLGGRTGALVLLCLAGSAVVALIVRRARDLGCPPSRTSLLAVLMLVTLPLATYSTQIWVEIPGALAAIASVVLLARSRPRRGAVAGLAALGTALKTRLGLILFPLAVVAWWPARLRARELRRAVLVLGAVAGLGLAASYVTFGHPLGYRRLWMLVPESPQRALTVVGGLLFDPAGGLAFSAPLLLLALGGTVVLWRKGGAGERAMLIGGVLTVLALLHSFEWYAGGAPPFRYLVPLLPAFALAGAMLLRTAPRWRPLAEVLIPPSVVVWWVLITRPHFSVNPGDGGWWLSDALARRFSADARHLTPSFLRVSPATFVVPLLLVVVLVLAAAAIRARPAVARVLARLTTVLWLLAAATVLIVLTQRFDRVVELEDPQVQRIGGRPEPPPGTFSRSAHANGWRVADREGLVVPLNLPPHARLRLDGWLEGPAQGGAAVLVSWDGGVAQRLEVAGQAGSIGIAAPLKGGRHRLRIAFAAPPLGEAVLDRLVVER